MTNPWRALRDVPDLTLLRLRIPDAGRYYHSHRAIVLRAGLTMAEARSTLMHELVHAERGDRPCATAELEVRQERLVDVEAANRLISLEALADALLWARDDVELAEELWVDVPTVRARRESLSPAETDYIEGRMAAKEDGAA